MARASLFALGSAFVGLTYFAVSCGSAAPARRSAGDDDPGSGSDGGTNGGGGGGGKGSTRNGGSSGKGSTSAISVVLNDGAVIELEPTQTIEGLGGVSTTTADGGKKPADLCPLKKFPENYTCEGQPGYWGEALQKALWFFNVNKSGPGIACTYVQWRGDAHTADGHIKLDPTDPNGVDMSAAYIKKYKSILDPDGNGEIDLSGGYHDAGDYIKFGLTHGFMAAMVAWSLYEFPESYRNTGLEGEALGIVRWATDYFLRSTFVENPSDPPERWNVIAFGHQVGDGTDHTCGWMPPELRRPNKCPRKGYLTTHEKPAADVTSAASAALALMSLVVRGADPAYADKCLNYATALYNFAAKYPDTKAEDDGGLYPSSYARDKLSWAAVWLYTATKNEKYIDDIVKTKGWIDGMGGFQTSCLQYPNANCWTESQTYTWDSARSAVFVKLAQILKETGHPFAENIKLIARTDTMGWVNGPKTPGGFATKVAVSWGSGRYNSAGQFVAQAYAKFFPEDAATIIPWAKLQSEYLLGKNPLKKSYMMGFTDKYANQPHHAAGHASIYGEPGVPVENRHILWGALVNGPADLKNDGHVDDRTDFGQNEVTIDYNASFVAALAATYASSGAGQCPLRNFPPLEVPAPEFYTRGKVNSAGTCKSQVEITMMNESIWVPRFEEQLTARYYIDVTELVKAGKSPTSMVANIIYDRGAVEFSQATKLAGPKPCETNGNMWYFELNYEGFDFWGEQVRLAAPRVSIVDFGTPDGQGCTWDASNDWSYTTLTKTSQKTPRITAYRSGKLIWGEEPECHVVEPPPEPEPEPVPDPEPVPEPPPAPTAH